MKESISELCVRYRMEHGITQTELASRCGVSLVTISKAEHGKKLQLITMGKILKVVGESQ